MGAASQRNKDGAMAAYLVKSGFPHGRRATATRCPPIPNREDVGSAAYRRRRGTKLGRDDA